MMRIGGGTLCVPHFNAFSFPVHRAVGTAAALGLIIATPAAIGFIVTGWGAASFTPGKPWACQLARPCLNRPLYHYVCAIRRKVGAFAFAQTAEARLRILLICDGDKDACSVRAIAHRFSAMRSELILKHALQHPVRRRVAV